MAHDERRLLVASAALSPPQVPPLVTVIGDALVDVRVLPHEPMRTGADVPATVSLGPGGQGANLAVRLARREVPVRLVCAIGDDRTGALLRGTLHAEGVELLELDGATGAVVVLLDHRGDRTMLSQRVPLLSSATTVVDWAAVFDTRWLLVSGYVLLEPASGLSASGPTPRRAITGCALGAGQAGRWLDAAGALQPHLVVLNLDEARTLTGDAADPMSVAGLLARRLRTTVVVTHDGGASAAVGDHRVEVGRDAAGPVTDTTGAGDAFAATIVARFLEADWPPSADAMHAAMRDAASVASAVARTEGAQGLVDGEIRAVSR